MGQKEREPAKMVDGIIATSKPAIARTFATCELFSEPCEVYLRQMWSINYQGCQWLEAM